jgi:hypothetical protein
LKSLSVDPQAAVVQWQDTGPPSLTFRPEIAKEYTITEDDIQKYIEDVYPANKTREHTLNAVKTEINTIKEFYSGLGYRGTYPINRDIIFEFMAWLKRRGYSYSKHKHVLYRVGKNA